MAIAVQYAVSRGAALIPARPELGHSANFLYMLRGMEPRSDEVKALDVSLESSGKINRRRNCPGCRINGVPGVDG